MFEYNDAIVICASCGYEDVRWRMIGFGPYFCNIGCKLEHAGLTLKELEALKNG